MATMIGSNSSVEMDMSSLNGIIKGMDTCSTSISGKISDSSSTVNESWTSSTSREARESTNTSLSYASTVGGSNQSDSGNGANKPHKGNDPRWEAIQAVRVQDGSLGLHHFRLLKRLGCGDIGSVYLAELKGSNCVFAVKVMDKASLASRKKLARAQTEKEILMSLDHPFLPTLYTHFETEKFTCLVMEFCSGGDLHTLRQRQSGKHFSEQAARFYASEVLLGLEYLHMMGIIYRDLKPENVLVREDGHIMLSDFDLALRCIVSPILVKSSSSHTDVSRKVLAYCVQPACVEPSCLAPTCTAPPSCFSPRLFAQRSIRKASKPNNNNNKTNNNNEKSRKAKIESGHQAMDLPEVIVEPTGARSMSFVGTHEYLAPEIIKGEGHGSAVDWWTLGIFMYELLHGKTPFKGAGNRATLFNVVGQPLKFPESPVVSFGARDLIRGLLVKDPQYRLAYKRGASEIKQHPFFEGVNWALIRSMVPPDVPKPFEMSLSGSSRSPHPVSASSASDAKPGLITSSTSNSSYVEFEFF